MSKFHLIWVLIFCFNLQKKEDFIEIDFQEGFQNTIVKVEYDRKVIFYKKITTDQSIGLAERIKVLPLINNPNIFLMINGKRYKLTYCKETPYLGIRYLFQKDTINVKSSKNIFLYD